MKIKYIGPSFGVDSLTNGKTYEAIEEDGMYRVIDDSGEDYLYSKENPAPLDGSSPGGKWVIVEQYPLINPITVVKVFPASAGVIPYGAHTHRPQTSFPRTCGGDPHQLQMN